jgi:exodeoxyribonuclease VII large subunit
MSTLFDPPFEDAPEPAPVARRPPRVMTVAELSRRIRGCLEETFGDVWVEGEISNCRLWNTGHLYFTLKDDAAQVRAVMFRSRVRVLRFRPEDGAHVVVRGRLGVYEQKGEYQLVCDQMEPRGVGALQLAFEQLKKRLDAEGLFAEMRKRPLPQLPRKIGVVTSLEGAAIRDILQVLRQRHAAVRVVVRPARVQGEGAAEEIARGLRQIARVAGVDCVIVGRGGGSIEDLWAFNEEVVARAIAACPVPVISAVGHQVDFTIADFVADVRAATPSNAAEIVIARKEELCQGIDRLHERLEARLTEGVHRRRRLVNDLTARRGFMSVRSRLGGQLRHTNDLAHALRHALVGALRGHVRQLHTLGIRLESQDPRRRIARARARLRHAETALGTGAALRQERLGGVLGALAGRLELLSPLGVLGRGYAMCWNEDRSALLRDASAVGQGDRVHVRLSRGELTCDVASITREPGARSLETGDRRPETDHGR